MSSEANQGIGRWSLTYSAPTLASSLSLPEPASFYNPFPELNDVAADGSQSAFPRRAKYTLPLDSTFLPTTRYIGYEELTEDLYVTMPPRSREALREELRKNPKLRMQFPRNPAEPPHSSVLHGVFEVVHKRLTASHVKWSIRAFRIAHLYETLEEIIASPRKVKIHVPLIADPHGDRLKQRWSEVKDAFRETLIQDEAVSLLACALTLDDFFTSRQAKEVTRAWVVQEDDELRSLGLPGFADYFDKMQHALLSHYGGLKASALTEVLLQDALRDNSFSQTRPELTDPWSELLRSLDRLDYDQVRALSVYGAVKFPTARIQKALAADMLVQSREKTFYLGLWKNYVAFEINDDDGGSPAQIMANPDARLVEIAGDEFKVTGSARFAAAEYVIMVESIRQQLCTGVGLRCPFWDGGECCEFKSQMRRVWDSTAPWSPAWKHHWQRPPCFG